MCLIIQRKSGEFVTKEFFQDVFVRNNDGWGIMWISGTGERRKVKSKSGMTFEGFWETYQSLENNDVECMIHFRMNTHGDTNLEMCHPFEVAPGVFMMHNGVVDVPFEYDQRNSDTWAFAELIVRPLLDGVDKVDEAIRSPMFKHIIKKLIGTGNRMVFMDKNGPVFMETNNWSKTTKGLIVSNEYAYTLDNPSKVSRYTPAYRSNAHNNYGYGNSVWPDYDTTDSEYYGYNKGSTALSTETKTAYCASPSVTTKPDPALIPPQSKLTPEKGCNPVVAVAVATPTVTKEVKESNLITMFSSGSSAGGKSVPPEATASSPSAEEEPPRTEEEPEELVLVGTVAGADYERSEMDIEQYWDECLSFIKNDASGEYATELVYSDPALAAELLSYAAEWH